jgi:hypothetical protein
MNQFIWFEQAYKWRNFGQEISGDADQDQNKNTPQNAPQVNSEKTFQERKRV